MTIHGGNLAARALKQAGADCIFTLCGGHVMPIYDGCLDEGIRIIDVRHEQAAVHAADAWSRLNNHIEDWANETNLAEIASAAEGDQRIQLFPDVD